MFGVVRVWFLCVGLCVFDLLVYVWFGCIVGCVLVRLLGWVCACGLRVFGLCACVVYACVWFTGL